MPANRCKSHGDRGAGRRAGQAAGFMAGEIAVPDDFDRMGSAEIEELFRGDR
jgi:hypothetical protein